MRLALGIAVAALLAAPAFAAAGEVDTADGILNPEQLTLNYVVKNYDFAHGSLTYCAYGYAATKMGDHGDAVDIFEKCSEHGSDAASIWMSYMSENGYAVRKSPEDAAAWAKKAADRGYKVGQYNYGLALLEGHGVKQDIEAGKKMIGLAAAQGESSAKALIDSGYNLDEVTPDPDRPKMY